MNTYEPFKLKDVGNKIKDTGKGIGSGVGGIVDKGKDIGGGIVDKGKDIGGGIVDKGKEIGGGIADKGKDIGGKIANVGKDIGNGIVNVGKKVGGALATFGKAVGAVFKGVFTWLLNFLMMIFKNWKLALSLALSCLACWFLSPILTPFLSFMR
jgi:hypothetical protein